MTLNVQHETSYLELPTFSLSQDIVLDCHRQAFMLSKHFIRSEDNQTTMPLYVLLS